MGSQCQDHFLNLERMRDQEVSVHTTHTGRSHSRNGSHVSHGEDTRNLHLEVDHLCRKLRRKQRRGSPSSSGSPSDDDDNYRPRSRSLSMRLSLIMKNAIIGKGVKAQPIGA